MEGGKVMRYLLAVNGKQLDICLKMLFEYGTSWCVEMHKTDKGKMHYHVIIQNYSADVDKLQQRYNNLIS